MTRGRNWICQCFWSLWIKFAEFQRPAVIGRESYECLEDARCWFVQVRNIKHIQSPAVKSQVPWSQVSWSLRHGEVAYWCSLQTAGWGMFRQTRGLTWTDSAHQVSWPGVCSLRPPLSQASALTLELATSSSRSVRSVRNWGMHESVSAPWPESLPVQCLGLTTVEPGRSLGTEVKDHWARGGAKKSPAKQFDWNRVTHGLDTFCLMY